MAIIFNPPHRWKCAECDYVRKKGEKKTSEADSFRHMEIKIYYTLEDGHVGRNM
jgi:ribosomal protein S27AE